MQNRWAPGPAARPQVSAPTLNPAFSSSSSSGLASDSDAEEPGVLVDEDVLADEDDEDEFDADVADDMDDDEFDP